MTLNGAACSWSDTSTSQCLFTAVIETSFFFTSSVVDFKDRCVACFEVQVL